MSTTGSEFSPIQCRRMSGESLQSVPRHFGPDGDVLASHIAACLSTVFPDGEDYFVRSVRHFRADITDPVLKRQVAGFIGQEAMHGRKHRAFNRRPRALHRHPGRAAARPEHPGAGRRQSGPRPVPVARARGVQARGGGLRRLLGGRRYRAGAAGADERGDARLPRRHPGRPHPVAGHGPAAHNPLRLARSVRRFLRSSILSKDLWRELRAYNGPGFHPSDRDATDLLATWREELFGADGVLNDRLARVA